MKYNYIVANYCVYYIFFCVTFKVIPIIYKDEILISRVYGQQTVTLKIFVEIFLCNMSNYMRKFGQLVGLTKLKMTHTRTNDLYGQSRSACFLYVFA